MKFLNKKEQVFDIQLTPYGKQKLSMGKLNPTYYAFFDDNVLYDIQYAHPAASEVQNETHKRIKQETAYLGSQVLFNDIMSGTIAAGGTFSNVDLIQKDNLYTTDAFIGDARLQSENSDVAPAWKVIAMQGEISSSIPFFQGTLNSGSLNRKKMEANITQINIDVNYQLKAQPAEFIFSSENVRQIQDKSSVFADDTLVHLMTEDALVYVEELNTELLVDNFDVEVFEVPLSKEEGDLRRLYFKNKTPQVVDGMLVSKTPIKNTQPLDTGSVEYYFSLIQTTKLIQKLPANILISSMLKTT